MRKWRINITHDNSNKFKKCVGIELSQERIDDFVRKTKQMKKCPISIQPLCKDALQHNYNDASVIYISNLCFPDHLNRSIGKLLDKQLEEGKKLLYFPVKIFI